MIKTISNTVLTQTGIVGVPCEPFTTSFAIVAPTGSNSARLRELVTKLREQVEDMHRAIDEGPLDRWQLLRETPDGLQSSWTWDDAPPDETIWEEAIIEMGDRLDGLFMESPSVRLTYEDPA
jgi:hypothetical protein